MKTNTYWNVKQTRGIKVEKKEMKIPYCQRIIISFPIFCLVKKLKYLDHEAVPPVSKA